MDFFYTFLSVLSDHLTTLRQVLARNVIMDFIFGRSCIKNSKQPRTTDQNHENTMLNHKTTSKTMRKTQTHEKLDPVGSTVRYGVMKLCIGLV